MVMWYASHAASAIPSPNSAPPPPPPPPHDLVWGAPAPPPPPHPLRQLGPAPRPHHHREPADDPHQPPLDRPIQQQVVRPVMPHLARRGRPAPEGVPHEREPLRAPPKWRRCNTLQGDRSQLHSNHSRSGNGHKPNPYR